MFNVLVLQTLYTLSNDQIEYQIRDRLSFMRFLAFALLEAVPARRRSGCSPSNWCAPAPVIGCSPASTRRYATRAIWRWAGRSSTRRWSRRAGRI
ncbi:MAG: transposase [Alphaproteobacteria bacterium]|nr:transposase [Alphaproteobacteria bacterium]